MARQRRSARKPAPSNPSRAGSDSRPAAGAGRSLLAFRNDAAPALWLALLAFIAYANAWPNVLVFDDKYFLIPERFSGLGLLDLARFFVEDLWASYGAESGLYRPLFVLLVALEWKLFGEWPAAYHLVNIALHAAVTAGVYLLVRQLLEPQPAEPSRLRLPAFLAAAVFAVHPVHAEAVNSVFNGSELWGSIGVVGGLLWLLKHIDARPARAWSGLALIYFAAMLTRETAVVLPALAALLILMYRPGTWRERLRRILPVFTLAVPLGIYFALRLHALGADDAAGASQQAAGLAGQALGHRPDLLFAPERAAGWLQSWFMALQLWVWPHPLRLHHPNFWVPVWLAAATHFALAGAAVYLLVRRRPAVPAGLAFFYITLFPASLFMARFNDTLGLQERFLYLPSVGLSLVLAALLLRLPWPAGRRLPAIVALAAVLAITPFTWARNADWSDNLSLFQADYEPEAPHPLLLGLLVLNQIMEGDFPAATRICDRHSELWPLNGKFVESCGQAYDALGRQADAERALLVGTRAFGSKASSRQLLGLLYARTGRPDEAREQFEHAQKLERNAAMRALREAQMLHALYPDDVGRRREALALVDQALELQPRLSQALQLRDKLEAADRGR